MPANSEKPNTRPRSEAAAIVDVGQRVPEVSARAARIGGTSSPENGPATRSREHEARGRVFGFSELAGRKRGSLTRLDARQFRKTEHPTPVCGTDAIRHEGRALKFWL